MQLISRRHERRWCRPTCFTIEARGSIFEDWNPRLFQNTHTATCRFKISQKLSVGHWYHRPMSYTWRDTKEATCNNSLQAMDDSDLQTVYRSVVIVKLTYASSAWCGFISATDRRRLDAFIRRSERSDLVPPNLLSSFAELCRTTEDRLFNQILSNKAHVLKNILPPTSVASQNYVLHQRRHHLELPNKTNHLIDNNFIQWMFFLDSY